MAPSALVRILGKIIFGDRPARRIRCDISSLTRGELVSDRDAVHRKKREGRQEQERRSSILSYPGVGFKGS